MQIVSLCYLLRERRSGIRAFLLTLKLVATTDSGWHTGRHTMSAAAELIINSNIIYDVAKLCSTLGLQQHNKDIQISTANTNSICNIHNK